MDGRALSGLSPIWLMGLALILGVTVVTFVPITFAGPDAITPGSWIGFCGSVLGGSLTVIGFFLAARNVNRQLRINLISREESRIEERLPQMEQLVDHLLAILSANANGLRELWQAIREYRDRDHSDLSRTIRSDGIETVNWDLTENSVEARMPLVDPMQRRRFLFALKELKNSVDERGIGDHGGYRAGIAIMEILFSETDDKLRTYKSRLVFFRAELERYFEL